MLATTTTLAVVHAVMALILGGYLVHERRMLRDTPALRWLWITLCCLVVGEAGHVPAIYFAIDEGFGPGWGLIVQHLAGGGAATAVLLMNDDTFARPGWVRRMHAGAGCLAMAVSVLPWLVDAPHALPAPLHGPYPVYYDATWRSMVHWAAFLAILAWALATCAWRDGMASRTLTDPHAKVGVRLVAAGNVLGLAYVAWHAGAVWAWRSGHGAGEVRWDNTGDVLTLAPALGTIILGLLWARLRYAAHDARIRRDLRLLKMHWATLVAVIPEVSPWPEAIARAPVTAERLHWQRTRAATEIHDAVRALTALVPEPVQDRVAARIAAAGLNGATAAAATEQVCLQLAIQAHQAGASQARTAREPRLYAADPGQAARAIARRLRTIRRPRVQRVIHDVLHEESHAHSSPPALPAPQDTVS